jgi:hypothetical protein
LLDTGVDAGRTGQSLRFPGWHDVQIRLNVTPASGAIVPLKYQQGYQQ